MVIAERIASVRQRIVAAAAHAERDPAAVRLIAVSKRMPADSIREAYGAGLRDFGENYVQELVAKAEALADLPDLRFHLIGHLQRNKARQVVQRVSAVHTVDTPDLARELGKRATAHPVPASRRLAVARGTTPVAAGGASREAGDPAHGGDQRLVVLVEVNVGQEAQKSGCSPESLADVLRAIEAEPALALAGLMTVPPLTEDPAGSLPYFEALARLRDRHGGSTRLPELSMGMTDDLEYAIKAGATLVRVGTAIFGPRPTAAATV